MPGPKNLLPGARGKDYKFVRYGDRVYVVYRVKLPNGQFVNMSWKVEKDDFKALGIKPENISKIGKAAFKNLNFFGSANEIARAGTEQHPFQGYLKDLKERYGGVSWINNKEFMSVMLMGWGENWSAAELEQRLKRTKWYQSRTDAQRNWELEMTKAERQTKLKAIRKKVTDALTQQFGEGKDWTKYYDAKDLDRIAKNIASGHWGDPSEGFDFWMSNANDRAKKIEGTQAWIDAQQEAEQRRASMNRPEDVREQIRQEAFEWLGPRGVPDDDTLTKWSQQLVSEVKSDGDWQQFLRKQATALYPWLGPEETWQDRASVYKKVLEENWGQPVDWDEGLLYELGEKNPTSGEPTGNALSYDQFKALARKDDRFWSSDVAKQEGSELFAQLNDVFRGVR